MCIVCLDVYKFSFAPFLSDRHELRQDKRSSYKEEEKQAKRTTTTATNWPLFQDGAIVALTVVSFSLVSSPFETERHLVVDLSTRFKNQSLFSIDK